MLPIHSFIVFRNDVILVLLRDSTYAAVGAVLASHCVQIGRAFQKIIARPRKVHLFSALF